MPPVPPQQQPEGHAGALWIVAGLFVIGLVLWYTARGPIVAAFFQLKLWEISLASFFTPDLQNTKELILSTSPNAVTFSELELIANSVGSFLRIPVALVLIVLSILCFFRSSAARFRKIHNMNTLLEVEVTNWPQSIPILKLNLVKEDIDKGPWAMAMTPMQFAKRYKLLKEEQPVLEEGKLRREARITVSVITDKANQVFVQQLGSPWRSVESLNIHTKALFAVFCTFASHQAPEARLFLRHVSQSATDGKLDFTGLDTLMKKYVVNNVRAAQVIQQHAFVLTVMASMLQLARTEGVLATAEFLWLKPVDRRLWFMLNTVGRQVAPTEVAGPFAHWKAERELNRAIHTPMIEEATKALEVAVKEVIYKPEEK